MSKDVKFIGGRRYVAAILVVILLNVYYVVNAFAETDAGLVDYTANIELSGEEYSVLKLINQERAQKGLVPLKCDSRLMEIAKLKINDMVEENYVSHNSDKYGNVFNMLKIRNINYSLAGENIARNLNESRAVQAWMNSNSHRENILEKRYEYTGISVVKDKNYGYLFVQVFME